MQLRRGFKTESERRAAEWRARLGLRPEAPLDPRHVARELDIPVVSISNLLAQGLKKASLLHLTGRGMKDFSAATLGSGNDWVIVENEAHSVGRRSNSLAHEVAHILLAHPPHQLFANGGLRNLHQDLEDEADWLGQTLLVPRPAALAVVRDGLDLEAAATKFGVSQQLMRLRLNVTGAVIQATRTRRFS